MRQVHNIFNTIPELLLKVPNSHNIILLTIDFDDFFSAQISLVFNLISINNPKFLKFVKIVHSSGFVDNFLVIFIGEFGVVDGVGPLDAFGDVVVKFFEEVVLVGFELFCDLACVGFQDGERFQTFLVFTLLMVNQKVQN